MKLLKKLFSDKRFFVAWLVVLFFAFFLRFFHLATVPFGFHRDELINVYVGRYILLNGQDLYGNAWPLFYFDKFGDFPPIFPMYLMGFSTFLFGVNEFATRFPSALLGALTAIPVYFLANLLYKNKYVSLLSAFLIAILPWHIVLSRMSAEGIVAVFCFVVGLLFLLRGVFLEKKKELLIAFPLLLITYFLYPSFRILMPLVVLPLIFAGRKTRTLVIVLVCILFVSTFAIASTPWGKARFNQTSVFSSAEVSNTIQAMTNDEGNNSAFVARAFHNKPVGYSREFLRQYFGYFSPNFLFMNGSTPHEYIVPDVGLLYIAFFLLFLGVLLPISVPIQKKLYYYFLYLLIISPIPAALTIDFTPHVHRALIMVIPIVILAPLGLLKIMHLTRQKKLVLLLFSAILAVEFVYFAHQYFFHISSYKSLFKNDGYREVTEYVVDNHQNYKTVYMPSVNLPLYYLFYTKDFDAGYAGKFNETSGQVAIDHIGNVHFLNTECPSDELKKHKPTGNILVIDSGICKTSKIFKQIGEIGRKDHSVAFKELTY